MFTHYKKYSDTYLAWSSCYCFATRSHFIGEEVYPPTPLEVRMSDINSKRRALMSMYGPSWRAKVKAMPDNQVVALYLKFKAEGKIK